MIDEKKLIDEIDAFPFIHERYDHKNGNIDFIGGVETMYEMVMNKIKEQPKIGRWIPCSERLPEEGQRVLATHKGGLNSDLQVIEHVFKNGEFLWNWDMDTDFKSPTFGQRYMGDVIAWQPLPEPYVEESEE